ncbi:hypothetical protein F4813DRAFT_346543 [Daldinia decipiens]|uniref:uncharacterized protein n=1 Tax=Daldinia decipiens TaxID=326647 RepID=UPI0020C2B12C|nr:uncharacterized protein F4813DRAFT_346543 [Daldinia decipiens]KAI1661128.1 hypothetical protein F4813DRAFT_346543 [Daldinia decipiens]
MASHSQDVKNVIDNAKVWCTKRVAVERALDGNIKRSLRIRVREKFNSLSNSGKRFDGLIYEIFTSKYGMDCYYGTPTEEDWEKIKDAYEEAAGLATELLAVLNDCLRILRIHV